ncbi:MAG: hypothetical protein AAGK14_01665 [Verrucomicrobiota bacterium]
MTESHPTSTTTTAPEANATAAPKGVSREAMLRAKVLRALKPCGEYWLDADTLLLQLALTEPELGTRELAEVLQSLREKAYVDFRVDEISALTEWRLTAEGQYLARHL